MIGIDANVLLRLVLKDDEVQSGQAVKLFERLSSESPGFINTTVLMEFIWTARRHAKMTRTELKMILSGLLDSDNIVLQDEDVIELVLDEMDRSSEEFTDIFIALKTPTTGCSQTMTFDRGAATKVPGMELLT